MTAEGEFRAVINRILSAEHVTIHAAAGAWVALAGAGTAERDRLARAAANAAAEPGAGLVELADRISGTASWAEGASAVAQQIANQLRAAGEASARASERALTLLVEYEDAEVELPGKEPLSPSRVSAALRGQQEQERLLAEAKAVLRQLSEDFTKVTGGDAPPAQERGGTTDTSPGGGRDGSVHGAPKSERAGTPDSPARTDPKATDPKAADPKAADPKAADRDGLVEGTPPSSPVRTLGGDNPDYLSVLGPENGEFSGWVQSPNTGHLVDPATGREFDPGSARWIDPVTGLPFGEATEYATRLSGLDTGPGAIATGVGLTGIGGGGPSAVGGPGGLAGMYGGVTPPSVAHPGPAQQQVLREAQRNLNQRAAVASRFAAREAALGGRPFAPPPAAMGGAAGRGTGGRATESGGGGRPTELTEDPKVWATRQRAGGGVLGEERQGGGTCPTTV